MKSKNTRLKTKYLMVTSISMFLHRKSVKKSIKYQVLFYLYIAFSTPLISQINCDQYFRANINGYQFEAEEFGYGITNAYGANGHTFQHYVTGSGNESSYFRNLVLIGVTSNKNIGWQTGTFDIGYSWDNLDGLHPFGLGVGTPYTNCGSWVKDSGQVTIQEITEEYIKGTFYGRNTNEYCEFNPRVIEEYIVTNGEFKLYKKNVDCTVEVDLYTNDELQPETSTLISTLVENTSPYDYNISADGTKSLRVIHKYTDDCYWKIRNYNQDEISMGSISETLTEDKIITHYTAPEAFTKNTIIYLDLFKKSRLHDDPIITIALNVKPVPVMLLHGLASSSSIWQNLIGELYSNGWNGYLKTPNYKNDVSFVASSSTIAHEITDWVTKLKSDGLLMNKISLVGHSMGGLVARQYVQNYGGKKIQKIITLNTPHSGSELANFVIDGDYFGIGKQMGNVIFNHITDTFSIENGALNSLKINSAEIIDLNVSPSTEIKAHAISSIFEGCDYFIPVPLLIEQNTISVSTKLKFLVGTAAKFLSFAYYSVAGACTFKELILPSPNDGVVREISQAGGLSGSAYTNYSGLLGMFHTKTPINSNINLIILDLLKAKAENNPQFADGFSPVEIPPSFTSTPIEKRSLLKSDSSDLKIVVQNLRNLDTLFSSILPEIEITGNDKVSGIMIGYYFVERDTIIIDSIFENSHKFSMPTFPDYEGELIIHCMGSNGLGEFAYKGFAVVITQDLPPSPTTPSLVLPLNESNNISTKPFFNWENTKLTASYNIQIAFDYEFSNLVVDSTYIYVNNICIDSLQHETTYYWRIRSFNVSGGSDWSDIWSFTTEIAPPTFPNLISPKDESVNITLNSNFVWTNVEVAETYKIQISENGTFETLVAENDSLKDNSFNYTLPNYETSYYWRVKANNSTGESPWSEVWSFSTVVAAPVQPSLVSPTDGSTDIPLAATLGWTNVQAAETYQVQIAEDDSFVTIIEYESNLINNTFDYVLPDYQTTYYWRVKATNSTGESPWSEIWNFTTEMITGIKEFEIKYGLTAYPNPTNNSLFIEFEIPLPTKATIKVFDSAGKTVIKTEKNLITGKNLIEVVLSQLSKGIYQYQVTGSEIDLYGKFIKI